MVLWPGTGWRWVVARSSIERERDPIWSFAVLPHSRERDPEVVPEGAEPRDRVAGEAGHVMWALCAYLSSAAAALLPCCHVALFAERWLASQTVGL